MISKITDDKILNNELVNNIFDELLEKKILIIAKPNLIIFSRNEFEKHFINIEKIIMDKFWS